jgi:dihydropyrimidinase
MLPVVFAEGVVKGRISLEQFVSCFTDGPARQFGLYPHKGTLQAGADADIVVWDPSATWSVVGADLPNPAGYSVFEGRQVLGKVVRSWVRGRPLVEDGRVVAAPGTGRRVARTSISSVETSQEVR